jgi:hypothetical protein
VKSVLERSEDFAHPGLAGMCCYQNVLDVFGLRRSGLRVNSGQ